MCLVVFLKMFQKIFFSVWLCSWKYYKKHIFYLLLTFSRLPNEYISFISQYKNTNKIQKKIIKSGHIFSIAKQIYNIIHSSIQKHKQNPKKKSSNSVKLREEGRERGDWFDEGLRSTRKQDCDRRGASRDRDWRGASRDRDRREGEITIDGAIFLPLRICESFFLSLFLPLRVCELLSLRVSVPEVI